MSENKPGPRKVIVGTAMHNMFHPYPGLQIRLAELADLVDRMAKEAAATRAEAAATRMAVCIVPPRRFRDPLQETRRKETAAGGILAGFSAFEKRKMFQRVYCSIGTPSYISSTRRICVSRE